MERRSIWTITEEDVRRLQGDERRFTELMNRLLAESARVAGVLLSQVRTNLRTKAKDGGVDAQVACRVPNADGLMERRTLWQFKAQHHDSITPKNLREEILGKKRRGNRGPAKERYVVRKLQLNYAYRFCICDSMTPQKREEWERCLKEIIGSIPPKKRRYRPRVVAADSIASWLSRFPALIIEFFRPELANAQSFDQWAGEATSLTRTFVELRLWQQAHDRIRAHVDLSNAVQDAVLVVRGLSGVGKTRLVHEVTKGFRNLVIYTERELVAEDVASQLAKRPDKCAILIADECSSRIYRWLGDKLRAHRDRLRVVAIDNSGERPLSEGEIWLEKMPADDLRHILDENFATVSPEDRQLFARLSKGFPRFAADLCENAPRIEAHGRGSVTTSVDGYLKERLRLIEEQSYPRCSHLAQALEIVSLFTTLGWKDATEAGQELDALCHLIHIDDVHAIRSAIHIINQQTGFIAIVGDRCYTTPEIVAETAFGMAFRDLRMDIDAFLRGLPSELLDLFLKRLGRLEPGAMGEEVRRRVGDFFRAWVAGLTIGDLTTRDNAERLMRLVDIDPALLSSLRRLVERASIEDLRRITGSYQNGRWGPRRALVWHLEQFASSREYFDDAEAILRRLALAESEPGIGNNATSIWSQLFRIELSGTCVDFTARLKHLEGLSFNEGGGNVDLYRRALDAALDPHRRHRLDFEIVGGRSRPPEWEPRDGEERMACLRQTTLLLHRIVERGGPQFQQMARELAAKHLRHLLGAGLLDDVRALFAGAELTSEILVKALQEVEAFLRFDRHLASLSGSRGEVYAAEVMGWSSQLLPDDLHSRLLRAMAAEWYDMQRARASVVGLAAELLAHPDALAEEIPFLFSKFAGDNATLLGEAMGRRDEGGRCLVSILDAAGHSRYVGFAKGYVFGLLEQFPEQAPSAQGALDRLEVSSALAALQIAITHPKILDPVPRALRLLAGGSIPVGHLALLDGLAVRRDMTPAELSDLLDILLERGRGGDGDALHRAIKTIGAWLAGGRGEVAGALPDAVQALGWQILDAAVDAARVDDHFWRDCLQAMAHHDRARALAIAARALTARGAAGLHAAQRVLLALAEHAPEEVMRAAGEVILDKKHGSYFYYLNYKDLIQGLPAAVVISWLRNAGPEGARRIARHVAAPHLNRQGVPVVPELTEFVLSEYADDDRVFIAFCAGVHSFQLYQGDIAAAREREADVARRFLHHPLRRVREWAREEIRQGQAEARRFREDEALRKAG